MVFNFLFFSTFYGEVIRSFTLGREIAGTEGLLISEKKTEFMCLQLTLHLKH